MGKRGPAPTPTAILKLRGSREIEKRKGEVSPDVSAPRCPEWLDDLARNEWERVVPELVELGVIAQIDRGELELYCHWRSVWIRAAQEVEENGFLVHGMHGPKKNPAVSVMNDAGAAMARAAQQLGLSPASRTGIKADSKPKSSKVASRDRTA